MFASLIFVLALDLYLTNWRVKPAAYPEVSLNFANGQKAN